MTRQPKDKAERSALDKGESDDSAAASLRLLLESTDQGIYAIDAEARCWLVNRAAAEMVGYTPEEMLGKNVHLLFHHTRADGSPYPVDECPIVRAIRFGKGVRVDADVFWRRDRTPFPVEYSSYPIVEGGAIKGAVVTFYDITRRKHLEEALRKARDEMETRVRERTAELKSVNEDLRDEIARRERIQTEREELLREVERLAELAHRRATELEGTFQNMLDGVFVIDAQSHVTLANEAGLRLFGISSIKEIERAESPLIHGLDVRRPDGRPADLDEMPARRALAGETVVGDALIIRHPRTHRDVFLRINAAPIRDEDGNVVGAVQVVRDVTEEVEFDLMKDQFITVAAHELKTPVAIMKGYAEALLRTVKDIPAPRRKMLEAIDRGADRIDRIVKDLLDISRLHLGHLELTRESIDLPEMVEEAVDRLAITATKHRLRLVSAEPVVVQGDRDRLEQVVINLIDNAIKYSPKGGDIDVTVDVADDDAIVSVTDRGVGIPRDKQKHIFDRFYRAHTGTPYDYGGMGVGLYISREIVSRHGGRMWFESEEGKGSSFHLSLPLGSPPAATS